MATPMRQGVWCLLPVVLNAVPIHTQCCDHYLRDEASWLMALAISSNKHHTHTHTHTHSHTSSHETRGSQSVVLPPANPPSLLLTAPPRSPTNPYPNHPATSPPPPQAPPPPCGMPAAVCLKEALCARRKTHSCAAEPSSYVCIVIHTHTHTHHSHRRLPERELVLLCLCETTIVSPSYTSRHGIHHIIINDIYIYIEREREGGSARGGC
jgi:hypothetical protein